MLPWKSLRVASNAALIVRMTLLLRWAQTLSTRIHELFDSKIQAIPSRLVAVVHVVSPDATLLETEHGSALGNMRIGGL